MSSMSSNMSESKLNYNNHYHLGERNTNTINIMSGIKSLVCDLNGIIIAEMVYRCMICDVIYETIPEVQIHYQTKHIDTDLQSCGSGNLTNCSLASNTRTDVSFFGSFQSTTDSYLEGFSNAQTLTFDVPSGLKTLQQQFESTTKVVSNSNLKNQKKTNKPFTSGNSKTKTGFIQRSKVLGQTTGAPIKSGFITCEICGATKFYKYTQRRFGVYSCVGCAKFYSKYLLKPVNYMCENLGKCNLKVSECEPNGRCKACLIHKCKSKFIIDAKKLSNYSKPSILSRNESKKVLNEHKNKTKSMSSKESIRSIKHKPTNQMSVESKPKTNLVSNKSKSETDGSSPKTNPSSALTKKLKSEKTHQKNENQNKRNSNISATIKSVRLKRNGLKSSEVKPIEKRTRSQSTCHKCSKGKDCNNCANSLRNKTVVKNNMRTKLLKKRYCLTRNRNK